MNYISSLRHWFIANSYVVLGGMILIALWQAVTSLGLVNPGILKGPWETLASLAVLHFEKGLVVNTWKSITLNFAGYLQATVIAVPIGFALGLITPVRKMFLAYINALRFLPLAALIGLFIQIFGIGSLMKIQFLTLCIAVYLIPTVVQRIDEVEKVYVQAMATLGASRWQELRHVYIPSVLSRLSDDLRVLIAISWTYIVIAETLNKSEGGVGAMIWNGFRESVPEQAYMVLLIVLLVGTLQDRILYGIDRLVFRHKYISQVRS